MRPQQSSCRNSDTRFISFCGFEGRVVAPTEAIVARLTQREDDTEEALAKRLEAFDSNRAAIEDAFSAMAKVVDGNRPKDSVWLDVKAFITA